MYFVETPKKENLRFDEWWKSNEKAKSKIKHKIALSGSGTQEKTANVEKNGKLSSKKDNSNKN